MWICTSTGAGEGNISSAEWRRCCRQEDNLMAAHDANKDNQGLAANYSIYNLSGDMLQCAGYSGNLDFKPEGRRPEELTTWNKNLDHLQVTL